MGEKDEPESRDEAQLANLAAADEFFARPRTQAQLAAEYASLATPPQLWAAFKRDSLRARAAHYVANRKEELDRLQKELGASRSQGAAAPQPTPEQLEDARLDAIGRQVNQRLRRHDPHQPDPAAPQAELQRHHQMGINR